jgi:hypothetical protein
LFFTVKDEVTNARKPTAADTDSNKSAEDMKSGKGSKKRRRTELLVEDSEESSYESGDDENSGALPSNTQLFKIERKI